MKKRLTTEEFIKRAKEIHGDDYDYSKTNYVNARTKLCIICHKIDKNNIEHGEFWVDPSSHLSKKKHICPKCSGRFMDKEKFVEKARIIHGDKYDYSKVEYKNNSTKVCIICHEKDENGIEHGEFWQDPTGHIDKKAGCPKCTRNHRYTTEEFLNSLPVWIKEKYDFSRFEYVRTHDKSTVICPEHGEFLMSPHNIRKGIGCPGCSESKLERTVRLFLKENGIKFVSEYKPNIKFHKQSIDFYLIDYNVGIECQGVQHFIPVDFAGRGVEWASNEYKKIIDLDKNKQALCKESQIKLVYYTSEENKKLIGEENNVHYNGYPVYTNLDNMFENILMQC